MFRSVSLRCGAMLAATTLWAVPVRAGDDAEKTGLIAALGLSAADGKTTIGENGGVIEASLLVSAAIDSAGEQIAQAVKTRTGDSSVLVLGKSESTNLIVVAMVRNRIAGMRDVLGRSSCASPGGGKLPGVESFLKLAGSDPIAAVVTSTGYAAIPLALDDRLLLNSVAIKGGDRFVFPGEITAVPAGSPILASYDAMVAKTNELRRCSDAEPVKSLVSAADALAASLDKSDGTAPSALVAAAQLESLLPAGQAAPYVLRVAIEAQGGTAITRSNIWYTLGFPGAAKVSAGLIASYRLVGMASGTVRAAGYVRCAVRPMDIGAVARVVTAPDNPSKPVVDCLRLP